MAPASAAGIAYVLCRVGLLSPREGSAVLPVRRHELPARPGAGVGCSSACSACACTEVGRVNRERRGDGLHRGEPEQGIQDKVATLESQIHQKSSNEGPGWRRSRHGPSLVGKRDDPRAADCAATAPVAPRQRCPSWRDPLPKSPSRVTGAALIAPHRAYGCFTSGCRSSCVPRLLGQAPQESGCARP